MVFWSCPLVISHSYGNPIFTYLKIMIYDELAIKNGDFTDPVARCFCAFVRWPSFGLFSATFRSDVVQEKGQQVGLHPRMARDLVGLGFQRDVPPKKWKVSPNQ